MPIKYGMKIKLQHCETGKKLHSHGHNYPEGSRQQQVTCLDEHNNDEDWWFFKPKHGQREHELDGRPVRNGDVVRLQHARSERNLHSHEVPLFCNPDQREVSCFEVKDKGDGNDDWRVESSGPVKPGEPFRLVHVATNHALHSHPIDYPFGQQQVTCFGGRDNNDFWKVCEHKGDAGAGHGGPHHGGPHHGMGHVTHEMGNVHIGHGPGPGHRGPPHGGHPRHHPPGKDAVPAFGEIHIGEHHAEQGRPKIVELPYPGLIVDSNTTRRGDGSGDRFVVAVHGRKLTVWRVDGPPGGLPNSGWGQDLRMSWRRANPGEHQPPPHFPNGMSPDMQYLGRPSRGEVHVGKHNASRGEPKVVELPYDGMIVDPDTTKRGDGTGDRFMCQVTGRQLYVWRIDGPPGGLPHSGWGQDLKLSWRMGHPGEMQPPPVFPNGVPPDVQYRGGAAPPPMQQPPMQQPAYGAPPGAPYGAPPGAPYGAPPGAPYGAPPQGAPPGAPYGAPPQGAPYGAPPGEALTSPAHLLREPSSLCRWRLWLQAVLVSFLSLSLSLSFSL
eukprot:m.31442 g.31442  ORF g.31442 m.31442 type:complete len:551 (+) comp6931_c0_seq2:2069-3721(+)